MKQVYLNDAACIDRHDWDCLDIFRVHECQSRVRINVIWYTCPARLVHASDPVEIVLAKRLLAEG